MKQVPFLLKLLMAVSLVAAIGSSMIWFNRQHKLIKMSEQLEAENDLNKRTDLAQGFLANNSWLDKNVQKGLYVIIAQNYSQLGQVPEMAQAFKAALEIDPRDHNLLNNLAYELAKNKTELDAAAAYSQRSMELAREEFKTAPWDMSKKRWEIAKKQTIGNYLDTYGWIFYQKGEFPKALKQLTEAFNYIPEPTIEHHLSMAYYQTGQLDSALNHLADCLAGQVEEPQKAKTDFETVYLARYKSQRDMEDLLAKARNKKIEQEIKADSASASQIVGRPAPEFSLPGLDGTIHKLSDHRGKVVALDFWATWCQPCKMGLPLVDKAFLSSQGKEVLFFAVNLEGTDKKDMVRSFWDQKGYGFPVLLGGMMGNGIDKIYQVTGIPTTFVIDKNGIIRYRHIGYRQNMDLLLIKEIEELLKQ
ncbi:redoxin domain-containing protein [candidate division TA06 bacterium]|uniref:Redoxin domain-containing protein n=1 Tax=candidate division TA06 bacterium TaxID=2250710 RepID=A0A933I9G6_UNCT6|nr:redoxin domain-containing protein [candidate division TA06 bacterium]